MLPLLLTMTLGAAACDPGAADVRAVGDDCARPWMNGALRINDLAAIGTHNSYKSWRR